MVYLPEVCKGTTEMQKKHICWTPCRTPSNTSAWKCFEMHRPCSRATSGHQVENQQRNWRPKGGRRLGFTWLSLRETTSTCCKHLQRNEDALSNTWGQKNGVQFHYFMVFLKRWGTFLHMFEMRHSDAAWKSWTPW